MGGHSQEPDPGRGGGEMRATSPMHKPRAVREKPTGRLPHKDDVRTVGWWQRFGQRQRREFSGEDGDSIWAIMGGTLRVLGGILGL